MKTVAEMIAEGFTQFSIQGEQLLAKYSEEFDQTVLIPCNEYNRFDTGLAAILNTLINEDYTVATSQPDCISVYGNILPQ